MEEIYLTVEIETYKECISVIYNEKHEAIDKFLFLPLHDEWESLEWIARYRLIDRFRQMDMFKQVDEDRFIWMGMRSFNRQAFIAENI